MNAPTAGVTIRPAFPDDVAAVERLARLDSQRPPDVRTTPLLLAEVDGEPWAALATETGRLYADPFRPTAALADLLRRAAHPSSATGTVFRLNAVVPATVPSSTAPKYALPS